LRTTISLPEGLLEEVEKLTNARSRREALVIALEDYIRRQRLRRVIEAAGTLEFELSAREIRGRSNRRLQGIEERDS